MVVATWGRRGCFDVEVMQSVESVSYRGTQNREFDALPATLAGPDSAGGRHWAHLNKCLLGGSLLVEGLGPAPLGPLNPALDPGQCITLSVDLCIQQRLDNSPNFKYSIIL